MFAEDLTAFFADFGVPATLAGSAVVGVFDNGHALGQVGMLGMATVQPTYTLQTALVPADPIGLAVVVAGQGYTVAEHQPDGTGITRLVLEAAA